MVKWKVYWVYPTIETVPFHVEEYDSLEDAKRAVEKREDWRFPECWRWYDFPPHAYFYAPHGLKQSELHNCIFVSDVHSYKR